MPKEGFYTFIAKFGQNCSDVEGLECCLTDELAQSIHGYMGNFSAIHTKGEWFKAFKTNIFEYFLPSLILYLTSI